MSKLFKVMSEVLDKKWYQNILFWARENIVLTIVVIFIFLLAVGYLYLLIKKQNKRKKRK